MKVKFILFLLTVCVMLSGCVQTDKLIDGESSGNSSASVEELLPDWSNWADLRYSPGTAFNLWKDDKGTPMGETSNTKAVDGKLSIYTVFRFDLDNYNHKADANAVMLVAVNDVLCNFTHNGEQSKNGFLKISRPVNVQHTELLTVSDCNMSVGENEITVMCAVYFPTIGWSMADIITRKFQSDIEQKQSETFTFAAEDFSGIEFIKSSEMTETAANSFLSKSSDFTYNRISYDSHKHCSSIAYGSPISFEFINKDQKQKPVTRNAVCLVLKNGELIPAWNGEKLLEISFTDDDLGVRLPVSYELDKGEYAMMSFILFNMTEDKGSEVSHHMKILYCTDR